MDVEGVEAAGAQVLVAVGNVGGAEDDISRAGIEGAIADGEAGAAFLDGEDFVVGVYVESGAFTDLLGDVANQGQAGAQLLALQQAVEGQVGSAPLRFGQLGGRTAPGGAVVDGTSALVVWFAHVQQYAGVGRWLI